VKEHHIDISPLQEMDNVHFFPACPHERVPGVMAGFDVGLIPYLVNPYTRGLSPIKLYEYMAMRKPVLGTCLPYLERERDHITLAGSPEEFVQGIQAALAERPSPERLAGWQRRVAANSWEEQAEKMEAHLYAILEGES